MKSHRLGRRRRKGGGRLPVAPWILITLVCVLVASVLTVVYMSLLRAGCGGSVYRVTVAAAPNISGVLHEQSRAWEQTDPEIDGRCVGVTVESVSAVDAARGLTGQWNQRQLGARPAAWVPDSDVWFDWVTGTEATAGLFSEESVVLGESRAVVAVPVEVAEALGWAAEGARPTWGEILDAAEEGRLTIAAASPRSSTEGLQAMLNVVVDAGGAIDAEAMQRYGDAVDAGRTGESAEALFSELNVFVSEGGAVEDFATVYTALDYQVDFFNRSAPESLAMVSVEPADARLNAEYPYLVLGGAGWVSEGDAAVAGAFGEYLRGEVAQEALVGAGFGSVGAEAGSLRAAVVTGETVRAAVRQWQTMRRDLNVLIVVDSSSLMSQDVEWGGEFMSAADAARRQAASLVEELGSASSAGLWEFGVGAGGDRNWRSVVEVGALSGEQRSALGSSVLGLGTYPGGSPLYDTLTAAYAFMSDEYVEDADNVIVVLTGSGVDQVSAPTVEQTASALGEAASERSNPVRVVTVGFGSADAGNLALLADSTGGSYLVAPGPGALLEGLRSSLVN